MGIFRLFGDNKAIKGEIGYFGLTNWWLEEFSKQERRYISDKFRPLGSTGRPLIEGDITYSSGSALSLLSLLAGWFANEKDRNIAYRILKKADQLVENKNEILDVHFYYQNKIQLYYKFRDMDEDALHVAIESCEKQIQLADQAAKAFKDEYGDQKLPAHVGYDQLIVIKGKQGKFQEAIDLALTAKQQGWNDDWGHIIERYNTKINKIQSGN